MNPQLNPLALLALLIAHGQRQKPPVGGQFIGPPVQAKPPVGGQFIGPPVSGGNARPYGY